VQIAFPLYRPFTALDLVGGYQVFAMWPDSEVVLVAETTEPVWDDRGAMAFTPTATFAEVPAPDVIMVPGSGRPFESLTDEALLTWLRAAAPTAAWISSVCSGSGLLAAAGLLEGRRATTHWAYREILAEMGVEVVAERWVFDGNVVTGAGVTAGIDMALALTARHFGDHVAKVTQLALEYDPEPPFAGGTKETSEPAVVEAAYALVAEATGIVPPAG
jgi:transcriptional regulator GlxA family with amidase domain